MNERRCINCKSLQIHKFVVNLPSNATDDDAEEYPLDEAYPLLLSPPPLLGGRRIGLPALLWVRIDFIF